VKGPKQARRFGGRPIEREPEPGKRAHLSLAVPLSLKRKVEQAAKKRGWSVSNEAAHRLEMSFSQDVMSKVLRTVRAELIGPLGQVPVGSGRPGKPIPEDTK
jgi:hypothetical protein